jgi:hypothetical protein
MRLLAAGHEYPSQEVTVEPFPGDFSSLFPPPPGLVEDTWPPKQISYLGVYLKELGCRTVVLESHYIDRDFVHDVALFYSRSLRSYPNHCQRLHFFSEEFDFERWMSMASDAASHANNTEFLQNSYLGFCVVRPLPGSPVGRTVLTTFSTEAPGGLTRSFGAVRRYSVHLAGFELNVEGLAFQQQDQGVSACATTALWSAMQKVTEIEHLAVPTPAQITEGASRYVLADGRALPSEGLNIQQMCEATRAAGLEPQLIRSVSLDHDRAQLLGYISSGLAPVLAIRPIDGESGHAVCAVGIKLGEVSPQSDPALYYRDAASAVRSVYVHDDRLGPYAAAILEPWTDPDSGRILTSLRIQWPDREIVDEQSILLAIIVPMPPKVRMSISRMRGLGLNLAQAIGELFAEFSRAVTISCGYRLGIEYQQRALEFGLTPGGLYALNCQTVLSRYVGLIELSLPSGPLFDVLLDATETRANPSALALIRRSEFPMEYRREFELIARNCGANVLW